MSKYHAVRTVVDDITFASKAEARRYSELRRLEKAGAIFDLRIQPVYLCKVRSATIPNGPVASFKYVADFEYLSGDGRLIAEDVKGVATSTYRLKIKIARACFPNVEFKEVK
jgi:hypothetical protein